MLGPGGGEKKRWWIGICGCERGGDWKAPFFCRWRRTCYGGGKDSVHPFTAGKRGFAATDARKEGRMGACVVPFSSLFCHVAVPEDVYLTGTKDPLH